MNNWLKQYKWKIGIPLLVVAVLAVAFFYGGDAPGLQGWGLDTPTMADQPETPKTDTPAEPPKTETPPAQPTPTDKPADGMTAEDKVAAADKIAQEQAKAADAPVVAKPETPPVQQPPAEKSAEKPSAPDSGMVINPDTGKDQYQTSPVPEGKPTPVEPQNATVGDKQYTCTISISCAAVLDNLDWLDPEKHEIIPEGGTVLAPLEVTFYEGESVFNVLSRVCKQNKIHLEFVNTPAYNSAYIEGIHNLYEFDCGELSGWMYKVNGWYPNYGASRYQLQDGDTIEWLYTCNLGVDIGGYNAYGGR